MGGTSGLEKFTDSGNSKLSICSEAAGSGLFGSAVLLFGEILNSDAGVAGEGFPLSGNAGGKGATGPPVCACIYGDWRAERGCGTGGGGISDNASGETEASSDSVEAVDVEVGFGGRSVFSAADSASSLRTWAVMAGVEAFFLR